MKERLVLLLIVLISFAKMQLGYAQFGGYLDKGVDATKEAIKKAQEKREQRKLEEEKKKAELEMQKKRTDGMTTTEWRGIVILRSSQEARQRSLAAIHIQILEQKLEVMRQNFDAKGPGSLEIKKIELQHEPSQIATIKNLDSSWPIDIYKEEWTFYANQYMDYKASKTSDQDTLR